MSPTSRLSLARSISAGVTPATLLTTTTSKICAIYCFFGYCFVRLCYCFRPNLYSCPTIVHRRFLLSFSPILQPMLK